MRRHTTLCCHIVQREDCVSGAACLKRADLLEIFTLKKQRRAAGLVESRARQDRRAMNMRPNPLTRRANAIEIERDNLAILGLADLAHRDTVTNREPDLRWHVEGKNCNDHLTSGVNFVG